MNRTTDWDPQHRRYWDDYGAGATIAPARLGLTSRAFAVPVEEALERKRMAALPKQKFIGWQGGGVSEEKKRKEGKSESEGNETRKGKEKKNTSTANKRPTIAGSCADHNLQFERDCYASKNCSGLAEESVWSWAVRVPSRRACGRKSTVNSRHKLYISRSPITTRVFCFRIL